MGGRCPFAYDRIIPVAFRRAPGGKIVALGWGGDRYELLDAPAGTR